MAAPADDVAAGMDVLRRLLRAVLAGEEGRPVEPVDLGAVSPRTLLQAVRRHRVPEPLHARAGDLGLPSEVRAVLDSWADLGRPRLLLQTLETVRSWQLLTDAGIDALVVKGQALAALTTGQAGARGAGDVDLLVAPDRAADAHRVLTGAGWSLHEEVEPGTWAWSYSHRYGNALTYRGGGADIDLHWRLEPVPVPHPDFDVLWARREPVTIGSTTVLTQGAYHSLRHSAGHREGWVWFRTLVDLRRLARVPGVWDGDLTPEAITCLAIARDAIGLPDGVPDAVHRALDAVPAETLARARRWHTEAVPASFRGGAGAADKLRRGLAPGGTLRDYRHAIAVAVLPPHAVLEVRTRHAWVGFPLALWRRFTHLVRARLGLRDRRPPVRASDAPCAAPPEHVA